MLQNFTMLTAYTPMIDLTGVDFSLVFSEIVALVPSVLPAVIGFLAVRKGIGFVMSMVRGA